MLAYGVAGELVDKYMRMSESTCLEPMYRFCKAIVQVFASHYLREPNEANTARLLVFNEGGGGGSWYAWKHRLHALGMEELSLCLAMTIQRPFRGSHSHFGDSCFA
jgi:hypothetical protein